MGENLSSFASLLAHYWAKLPSNRQQKKQFYKTLHATCNTVTAMQFEELTKHSLDYNINTQDA